MELENKNQEPDFRISNKVPNIGLSDDSSRNEGGTILLGGLVPFHADSKSSS